MKITRTLTISAIHHAGPDTGFHAHASIVSEDGSYAGEMAIVLTEDEVKKLQGDKFRFVIEADD